MTLFRTDAALERAPMVAGGYGSMRATDADRENVHAVLQSAYADGRLTWEEFDVRSTALVAARTYNELAALTADLRGPAQYGGPIAPYQSGLHVRPAQRTSPLAVTSMCFGIGQIFLPLVGAIVAIACGHVARKQIRQTGEAGAPMAMAGLVLGYLGLGMVLLLILTAIGSSH